MKIILKFIFILFLFYKYVIVQSTLYLFQPNGNLIEGEWLNTLDWSPVGTPNKDDNVIIGYVNNRICYARETSTSTFITASEVNVGYNLNIGTIISNMSKVSFDLLYVVNDGSNAIFGLNNNGESLVNISGILTQTKARMVSSVSKFENQLLQLTDSSQISFVSSKSVVLNDFIVFKSSTLQFINSNVLIQNGDAYPSNVTNSILEFSNSTSDIYGDLNIFYGVVNIVDNSKVKIHRNQKDDSETVLIYLMLDITLPSLTIHSSELIVEKYVAVAQTMVQIVFGRLVFNDNVETLAAAFLSYSSVVEFNEDVAFYDTTILKAVEGSVFNFNSKLYLVKNSSIALSNSEANIKSDQVFELTENSFFFVFNDSVLNLHAGGHNFDTSRFGIESSQVRIDGDLLCFNSSNLIAQNSIVSIEKDFILNDLSMMASIDSNCSISGSLILNNNSSMVFKGSNVVVNGLFLDNTLGIGSSNGENTTGGFLDSNIIIDGIFKVYGIIGFINSKLVLNNEFINYGTIVYANSVFTIKKGNLSNHGGFFSENSTVVLEDGYIFLYPGSTFASLNSSFTLFKGELMVSENVIFKFKNSTLYNYNQGSVKIQGDIILEIDGFIENNSSMILYSNVLPNNTNGNENFLNQGNLSIINNNSTGFGGSNIMVPLFNNGSIILGSDKELNVFEFKQTLGGDLNLNNNSIINSNKTITIDSSFINGNGIINTSIEFSNAIIGNNKNNDKIITQLNINGEFKSNQDQFNFIIQSESNSSSISINNNATIVNSKLIIKINLNSKDSLNNKVLTLMNFNNLNGDYFGLNVINDDDGSVVDSNGYYGLENSGSSSNSNGNSNIQFKFYNPDTGEEEDVDPNCSEFNTQISSRSLKLLVGSTNKCSKSKLSTGAIIGIVIGVAAFAILLGVLIKLKSNWFYLRYYSIKKLAIKKKVPNSVNNKDIDL